MTLRYAPAMIWIGHIDVHYTNIQQHAAAQLATLYGSQTRDVSENLNVVERAALNKRNKVITLSIPRLVPRDHY
jgi:hypothetical protein